MTKAHFEFVPATQTEIQNLTARREGEVKLGEEMTVLANRNGNEKFLLLGINEDFGPQINGGKPGCTKAFGAFLSRFVNMQSNRFLSGKQIFVLGQINMLCSFQEVDQKTVIDELDGLVSGLLLPYIEEGITPIVIGGGHNNAFPLIQASCLAKNQKINVINCDAHADFRKSDTRHSGNPFSFAFYEGFMETYAVLGLHQSYNNEFILRELHKNLFFHTFFDDYLLDATQFDADLVKVQKMFSEGYFGLELDMDSIAYMPSSALSPSGISLETARKYVSKLALKNCLYLHLPEAAPQNETEIHLVGKALAYLVSDFVKNQQKAD